MKTERDKRMARLHRFEELDGKELHRAKSFVASTIWVQEDPIFPAHQQEATQHFRHLQMWCYASFKGGGIFA